MEEKPIISRENPIREEAIETKAGAKVVNLYIEGKNTELEKIPLGMEEEISKPLSKKIDEYEEKLKKTWKYNPASIKLKDILKKLIAIQQLAISGDSANPSAKKRGPEEIKGELLRKIDELSGIEDLKELCEIFRKRLVVGEMPESHPTEPEEVEEITPPVLIETNNPSEETIKLAIEQNEEPVVEMENSVVEQATPDDQIIIKDEILNILDKKENKNQKREEGLKVIIDSINNKIEEFKTEKKNTSILRYNKRKTMDIILVYLEAMRQSIAESGTVRPDLLYRIEKVEGLNDLYKSISSERAIEKRFFPRSRQNA